MKGTVKVIMQKRGLWGSRTGNDGDSDDGSNGGDGEARVEYMVRREATIKTKMIQTAMVTMIMRRRCVDDGNDDKERWNGHDDGDNKGEGGILMVTGIVMVQGRVTRRRELIGQLISIYKQIMNGWPRQN